MAASVSSLTFPFFNSKPHFKISQNNVDNPLIATNNQIQSLFVFSKSKPFSTFQSRRHLGPLVSSCFPTRASFSSDMFPDNITEEERILPVTEETPLKFLLWVVFWASLSLVWFSTSGDANAAVDSIRASAIGLKIATALRRSGWPDEAVVFALATLPVLELRGAIPVGYWMQLKPVLLTVLSVLGNMVPVPFIILYLKKFASFLAGKNRSASQFLDMLFQKAKEKAGPVEEFQWLGLMLFVAVPFPGTGAWTGAFIAAILDMPFWSALSANFFGVVIAGLLVNLLVNLGLKYAIVTGMWWCIIYKWGLLPLVFAKVFVVGMRIGNVVATCCPYLIVLWDNLTSEYGVSVQAWFKTCAV